MHFQRCWAITVSIKISRNGGCTLSLKNSPCIIKWLPAQFNWAWLDYKVRVHLQELLPLIIKLKQLKKTLTHICCLTQFWLFHFCILFILGDGNNLAHFSFFIVVSFVCSQSSVRFTCPSTVERYQHDKYGREPVTIKDNLKGINCLVCSVFVLPLVQTRTVKALVLLVDFVAFYFLGKNPTYLAPLKSCFMALGEDEGWRGAPRTFVLQDKLNVLGQ